MAGDKEGTGMVRRQRKKRVAGGQVLGKKGRGGRWGMGSRCYPGATNPCALLGGKLRT